MRWWLPEQMVWKARMLGHGWVDRGGREGLPGAAAGSVHGGNGSVMPACAIGRVAVHPLSAHQDTQCRRHLIPAVILGARHKKGSAGNSFDSPQAAIGRDMHIKCCQNICLKFWADSILRILLAHAFTWIYASSETADEPVLHDTSGTNKQKTYDTALYVGRCADVMHDMCCCMTPAQSYLCKGW